MLAKSFTTDFMLDEASGRRRSSEGATALRREPMWVRRRSSRMETNLHAEGMKHEVKMWCQRERGSQIMTLHASTAHINAGVLGEELLLMIFIIRERRVHLA